ncbi:MAG: hypothetical protein CL609_23585 [Anaerolineaceae bacterium]|nr:hypothetical protein [Anaerolineaceae bacterium]
MAVYVDPIFDHGEKGLWCHLTGESMEELHTFAKQLGLRRIWFQPKSIPHYDLNPYLRQLAVENGAIPLSRKEFVKKVREMKAQWGE